MKTKTAVIRTSINWSPLRYGLFLTLLALTCFALSPSAPGLLPPTAPDGGYPNQNTAEGTNALFRLTTGKANTAMGADALLNNITGNYNTAIGSQALASNTTTTGPFGGTISGNGNTAVGNQALFKNTTGSGNTAIGDGALFHNTVGGENTAIGDGALAYNVGRLNTAIGHGALFFNTTGFENTANGYQALFSNTTGFDNTASGVEALASNRTGSGNIAIGEFALHKNTTGSANIALGISAGSNLTTGNSNIDIGNEGMAGEANTIRIGTSGIQTKIFIAGITGAIVPTGVAVIVGSNGRLGTTTSSGRFKETIQPMDKASEAILALKPVTFRYKHEFDPDGIPQFGLVAEEVEKVNRALVAYDDHGKPYTVRYEAVNAMLLNEFLKEHRKVEELENTVATLAAMVKEQASQIQKVSAQLQLQRPATRVVKGRGD